MPGRIDSDGSHEAYSRELTFGPADRFMIRSTSSGGGSDKQGRVYADHLVDGVVEVEHDWRQGQPASVEHDGTGPTNFLDPKRDGFIGGDGRRRGGKP